MSITGFFFLSTTTSPLEGFKAPDIIFNRVDFPEPFVPLFRQSRPDKYQSLHDQEPLVYDNLPDVLLIE